MKKRPLTTRYTLHQVAYWAVYAGVVSFATTYLLEKGFAPAQVGLLLAAGNLISCGIQPVLANFADRAGSSAPKWMLVGMTGICILCFGCVQLLPLPRLVFGALYLAGVSALDAMVPLVNAISVSYNENGFRINYGFGRGMGSLGYALAALAIGRLMEDMGVEWMVWISLFLLVCGVIAVLGYPTLEKLPDGPAQKEECCSLGEFFGKYRWFCFSLLGVMLLAMFHAMTENYLIEIMRRLGGGSDSVGVALFIATAAETVVLVFFDRVRKHIRDAILLKLSGIFFLLKALLFLIAPSVTAIYLIQLLQAVSYSFLSPTQLYYARSRIRMADMVKGQAFITASYALGCALGNFAGGQLLQHFDVPVMLWAGVAMAAAGTTLLFATVEHRDLAPEQ